MCMHPVHRDQGILYIEPGKSNLPLEGKRACPTLYADTIDLWPAL
jgi:hypothetical protein